MFQNYLKAAFRNLNRQKLYTSINIVGLAIGISCCILIFLYVQSELSYDAFHRGSENLYRVVEKRGPEHVASTAAPLAPAVITQVAGVDDAVRLAQFVKFTGEYRDKRHIERNYLLADPNLFSVLSFEFLQGDPNTALSEPNSIVMTRSTAQKYFGDKEPFGKIFRAGYWGDVVVTGILKDLPKNSHLQFDMLLPLQKFSFISLDSWDTDRFITYIRLQEGIIPRDLEEKLADLVPTDRGEDTWAARSSYLQPIRDVHFHSSHIAFEHNVNEGEYAHIVIISAIGLFIILVACINYMNLSTAAAIKRSREIGLRKTIGAKKRQLVQQFLAESVLTSVIAFALAIGMVELSLPYLNELLNNDLRLGFLANPELAISLLLMAGLVGLVSGSYPALYLSKLQVIQVFKAIKKSGASESFVRRGLVALQFTISIILLISTLAVYHQLNYIRTKYLGFDKEHLVAIQISEDEVEEDFEPMKRRLLQSPSVLSVSACSSVPGDWMGTPTIEILPKGDPTIPAREAHFLAIDEDFLATYGIELESGNNFSTEMTDQAASVLLNETAVKQLGLREPEGALLQARQLGFDEHEEKVDLELRVIGVIKDFHFSSLHKRIKPMVLGHWSGQLQSIEYFTVRLHREQMSAALAEISAVHDEFDKATPLQYRFLDDRLNEFYQTDQLMGNLFRTAAMLALLIACLGVFGLVSFTVNQRTSEIGIRKVLGASVTRILTLLSGEFIKVIVIANLIAWPLAYLAMQKWLSGFAYRISLDWWLFCLGGGTAFLIVLLTVSLQSLKAAMANPVDILRYE